jgi:L-fuconolactonase
LARSGITGTVLVQAAPTEAETRFLLDVARRSGGLVKGVVGWVDMAGEEAPQRLAALARDSLLRSVRPMIQDIPDPAWMLDPRLDPAFRAVIDLGLRFDALVKPPHLPHLRRLLDRYSDLPCVIDHGAKPPIAEQGDRPWRTLMAGLARDTRVWCKLSGLVTEAARGWRVDDLRPYVDHLLECFGPARLMWGSDWPVVELAGGYERWRAATLALLGSLSESERARILGANAVAFYDLNRRAGGGI